jgi:hypothetical protein
MGVYLRTRSAILLLLLVALFVLGVAIVSVTARRSPSWRLASHRPVHGADNLLPFSVALRPGVLRAELHSVLRSVSDPASSLYGQHYSREQLATLLRADNADVQKVIAWLQSGGAQDVHLSFYGDYVNGQIDVDAAIALFGIKFYNVELDSSVGGSGSTDQQLTRSMRIAAIQKPHIPAHLRDAVEMVHGLHVPLADGETEAELLAEMKAHTRANFASSASVANPYPPPEVGLGFASLSEVWMYISVASLPDALSFDVSIEHTDGKTAKSTIGVNDTTQSNCIPLSDLGELCMVHVGLLSESEFNITISVSYADGSTTSPTFWGPILPRPMLNPSSLRELYGVGEQYVGHPDTNNSFAAVQFQGDSFSPSDLRSYLSIYGLPYTNVSVLSGSNVESMVGAEASMDIDILEGVASRVPANVWVHPNPTSDMLGWVISVSAAEYIPWVLSISWGVQESTVDTDRIEYEFMKIGLRGVSLLAAAGDGGFFACSAAFSEYPSTSAYVTSVGGAMQNGDGSTCSISVDLGVGYTATGGFSTGIARPDYQDEVVKNYITSFPMPSVPFNRSNRAVPDLSANGANIIQAAWGVFFPGGGTSAATPTVAGMISLLNEVRLQAGQPPLGFLNYFLYAHAFDGAFNDITTGNNRCLLLGPEGPECCPTGFTGEVGWDAVTGLGTPNFTALVQIVSSTTNLRVPSLIEEDATSLGI